MMKDADIREMTYLRTRIAEDETSIKRRKTRLDTLLRSCDHKHPNGESAGVLHTNEEQSYTACWLCGRTIIYHHGFGYGS